MSGSSTIAKRYARAFFDIAAEENRYEEYYVELLKFSSIVEENADLKEFLSNPIFNNEDKKEVVKTILEKISLSGIAANFLNLLADKQRIGILPDVVRCYREFMDEALKKVRVHVKTAFTLSSELSEGLMKGLEEMTGKQVEMTVEEDPSLLGGVVVKVGDTLYDGSIKSQLNNIRNLLGEGI
ncbi:MAG TPA: F0F1 ATP synthase subunit delta [Syntrophales bacterium]|nr:F0F1 ATP synthase subunit delta [Syntrophales bacterium]HQA82278.1 F0F1 ATP synthase subunit delta [Syntrophales bacterium]